MFDRINVDPKIQIKYIDTQNQLADMLTKGNFTRDEWNHLLCLFNISHFSSINNFEAMSKRTQEDVGEKKNHSKIKADDEFGITIQRLVFRTPRLHRKARGKPDLKVRTYL